MGVEEEEEEEEEDEPSAERVVDLSRRIALRCLHVEQQCLRRERAQTRLFQEQLRGVRQAAQDMTRRVMGVERSRAKERLAAVQAEFEGRERTLVAEREKAEERCRAERDALDASAAARKSELDKTRRLSREAAEADKKAAEEDLVNQRLSLQRGWAEEKTVLRRAADDALRRATEGRARSEEEAARQARTTQESLEAQVRSWKAKAEAAEKRSVEERDRRRGLEAGAKSALVEEADKARQAQDAVLRELRTKSEADRTAHTREIERLEEEHRAHILRIHEDKKKSTDAARRRWQLEMQEVRAEASAKAEEAATRAAAERTEALRRQRLVHDAEMRKAGRDVLRLEREARRHQDNGNSVGVVARAKRNDSMSSPLSRGNSSSEARPSQANNGGTGGGCSCLGGLDAQTRCGVSCVSLNNAFILENLEVGAGGQGCVRETAESR